MHTDRAHAAVGDVLLQFVEHQQEDGRRAAMLRGLFERLQEIVLVDIAFDVKAVEAVTQLEAVTRQARFGREDGLVE